MSCMISHMHGTSVTLYTSLCSNLLVLYFRFSQIFSWLARRERGERILLLVYSTTHTHATTRDCFRYVTEKNNKHNTREWAPLYKMQRGTLLAQMARASPLKMKDVIFGERVHATRSMLVHCAHSDTAVMAHEEEKKPRSSYPRHGNLLGTWLVKEHLD